MCNKKILLIHHSGLIGGAGISLFYTWMALKKQYNVVCYIPNNPSDLWMFLKERGLNPRTFPFRLGKLTYYSGGNKLINPKFWYHAFNSLFQISYWKKVINEEQPDLVIVNSKVLCWMGIVFKALNKKSLCFVRETIPENPENIINRLMRCMLDTFTMVAFLSEYDLNQTRLKKAESVVSPDFLEVANYEDKLGRKIACQNINISSNSFNVLFVGGMDKLKGIDLLVKAANIIKNEDITFIVAGKDFGDAPIKSVKSLFKKIKIRENIKFARGIKAYIKNQCIENKIKFIGIKKDISIAFSACDVLVFPMKEPHQARPAFEIGVQKKPVIITNFSNVREFVKDGYNGLTFEPNNPKQLAKAILKLKNDKELLEKLGENNYKYTMKYHTESYAMDMLIKKIDEILEEER